MTNALSDVANRLRIESIRATTAAGSGHPTSCASAAELMAALFFGEMSLDIENPRNPRGDRFVLSKGHAAPILYAVWAELGVVSQEALLTLRQGDSIYEGHPTPRIPFVDTATGSLGQGLSFGLGMAIAQADDGYGARTFVLMGDGESAEGSVWEAVELAGRRAQANLTALVDLNRLGQSAPTMYGHDVEDIAARYSANEWHTQVVDGHDVGAVLDALEVARGISDKPSALIAMTYKGHNIVDVEDKEGWHGKPLSPEHADRAVAHLESLMTGEPAPEPRRAEAGALVARPHMKLSGLSYDHQETGLPTARLEGERGRTVGQLRLFASHIRKGDHLDRRHDAALPDRKPLPRPELTLIQRPVGPVAVFGASNFPLAFSVAGGDTASALAAGCPVVVKGHSAHPGTGELVAQAVHAAILAEGLNPGVFSLIQGGRRDVGEALVKHPLIRAVGFTGSLAGGRTLFDLCAQRPDPIPFFGELGSVNPMFLLPTALKTRGPDLAKGWAASLTMGAGQFCTNPGIAVVIDGPDADAFVAAARDAVGAVGPQTMLTDGIAAAYRDGQRRIAAGRGVREVLVTSCDLRSATPYLYEVSAADWLADHRLSEEVFGPLGLILRARDSGEVERVASSLEGQLTCTLHMDAGDGDLARRLLPILERKAGRIIANGFPTGVEVADAMVHGGPYPASTNFGHTSVGTLSIRRWLRPVCYQNLPEDLLVVALA